jgi:heterodisulfide reductase subunit C
MESEILRDKDIIWQCVSCNKCTYACPRDVVPEGVMKALSHWLELKGHVAKSPSMVFDEVFSEQVFQRGKIEEGRVMQRFFKRTGQDLRQPWLIEMVKRMLRHLPLTMLTKLGLATLVAPSTSGWSGARAAIEEYVHAQEHKRRRALGLDGLIEAAKRDAGPAAAGQGART